MFISTSYYCHGAAAEKQSASKSDIVEIKADELPYPHSFMTAYRNLSLGVIKKSLDALSNRAILNVSSFVDFTSQDFINAYKSGKFYDELRKLELSKTREAITKDWYVLSYSDPLSDDEKFKAIRKLVADRATKAYRELPDQIEREVRNKIAKDEQAKQVAEQTERVEKENKQKELQTQREKARVAVVVIDPTQLYVPEEFMKLYGELDLEYLKKSLAMLSDKAILGFDNEEPRVFALKVYEPREKIVKAWRDDSRGAFDVRDAIFRRIDDATYALVEDILKKRGVNPINAQDLQNRERFLDRYAEEGREQVEKSLALLSDRAVLGLPEAGDLTTPEIVAKEHHLHFRVWRYAKPIPKWWAENFPVLFEEIQRKVSSRIEDATENLVKQYPPEEKKREAEESKAKAEFKAAREKREEEEAATLIAINVGMLNDPARFMRQYAAVDSEILEKSLARVPDHAVLGLRVDANREEINKRFRELGLQWHPDKNPYNTIMAAIVFKRLGTAKANLLKNC